MRPLDAVYAFLAAVAVSSALTPLAARLAVRVGAVDRRRERGLAPGGTPLLGGLAIFAAVLVASAFWLPDVRATRGILIGAGIIVAVGAVDDVFDLHPGVKFLGEIAAALAPVLAGVTADNVTLPFFGALKFGHFGGAITVVGLVGIMNVVNFSDGIDGLAAGVGTISGIAFAIIAFDLDRDPAAVLAALTAGAALGFLFHNFHPRSGAPASVFMGDCGALLLGYLLGCATVYGSLKTNAVVALIAPLAILAVPFLDTGFVVAKRLKYRRKPWEADTNHFHHRFARIGFSPRRTVMYMYAWTLCLTGLAIALRFVPYSDHHGHFNTGWCLVMGALGLLALAASVYLVYVLEILKFSRVRARQIRETEPGAEEWEVTERVSRDFETGEWDVEESQAAP